MGQQTQQEFNAASKAGIAFIEYIQNNWMDKSLWQSWSAHGRSRAAAILSIPIKSVIPTTNHLESFNGILKHKHIARWQRGGKQVWFDFLIFLLTTQILPSIFRQRRAEIAYKTWLSQRFKSDAGGIDLTGRRPDNSTETMSPSSRRIPVAWWTTVFAKKYADEAQYIFKNGRITGVYWLDAYTLTGRISSSRADIQQPNHQQYILCISLLGWATCECQSFQQGNGACKHLHSLRLLIPSLSCPYSFRYPATELEARKLYESLFSQQPAFPPLPPTSFDLNNLKRVPEVLEHVVVEQSDEEASTDGIGGVRPPDDSDGDSDLSHNSNVRYVLARVY